MLLGFGDNETEATANASSKTTATPVDEIKLELDNGITERYASGSENPILLDGVPDLAFSIKKLFTKADDIQSLGDLSKKAVTMIFTGDSISAGVYSTLMIKLFNTKIKSAKNNNKVEEYVYDETEYFVEHDKDDAKAMQIVLKNKVDLSNY